MKLPPTTAVSGLRRSRLPGRVARPSQTIGLLRPAAWFEDCVRQELISDLPAAAATCADNGRDLDGWIFCAVGVEHANPDYVELLVRLAFHECAQRERHDPRRAGG